MRDDSADLVTASVVVDRQSPVPLYFQVAQQLESAITSKRLPPGSRLDNEIALAGRLGLSRPTMRKAIEYLVDKGLVVRRRGIGTHVVHSSVRRSLELTSLFEDLDRSGQTPSTAVLSLRVIEADEATADHLAVPVGSPLHEIVRLRSSDGEPIARMRNLVPADLVDLSVPALEHQGLYGLLRAAGIQLHSAAQSVGARQATAAEARLLDEHRGAAVLTMTRTAYDDSGRAVEFGDHIYAASRYTFEISLLAGPRP